MYKLFKHGATRAVIYTALCFYLLTGSCLINIPSAYGVEEAGDDYQVRCEWGYAGKRWRYEVDIPVTIYNYFSKQTRNRDDYSIYAYNEMDDDWLGYTANSFAEIAEMERWDDLDTIDFVMSFVQCLPYETDSITTGLEEYQRYPVETMVDAGVKGGVDCEDTVVLLVTILSEMGYDTALLMYADDQHMAAGVGVSQQVIDNWNRSYDLSYYSAGGIDYAYCETTGEGYRLGQKPDNITGSAEVVTIVPVQQESA